MSATISIPTTLNQGQAKAYEQIVEHIAGPNDGSMFLLEGYAGTGKTYLVSQILKYLKSNYRFWHIAITAPTNKAVKVAEKSAVIKNKKVEYCTIHKLLGLKEEITSEGKQIFTSDKMNPSNIEGFGVLILDEVSMLNDELFLEVYKYCRSIKIIFLGDPCQIPPVGKADCIPFTKAGQEKYNIKVALLTEIMRQKNGNPIIPASFEVRSNLVLSSVSVADETQLNDEGKGIVLMNPTNSQDEIMSLLEAHFTSTEFKADPDYCKVIACKTINAMNAMIRKMIYGDKAGKIMIGEKLLANKPIILDNGVVKVILMTTNEEFEVLKYEIKEDREAFKYYNVLAQCTAINGVKFEVGGVRILHEDSADRFALRCEALRQIAINTSDHWMRKTAWGNYYDFARKFADVGYNYSISAHKSQGSSYRNVFLLEDDIDQNKNIVERNRIKYTAMTRAVDKLYVLKR